MNETWPWQPNLNMRYYTYASKYDAGKFEFPEGCEVIPQRWHNVPIDFSRFYAGMVFRTKEAAKEAFPKVYKRFTGKEWREE